MAELVFQSMSRNGVSTPSTAATQLTQSTSTVSFGLGFALTTANSVECLVDPDDKVGFLLTVTNTTLAGTLTVRKGSEWQGVADKTISIGGAQQNQMYFIGPFESAKYINYDSTAIGTGKPHIRLTQSGTTGVRVVGFKFPTVSYAT
jgi:hypothetical protein